MKAELKALATGLAAAALATTVLFGGQAVVARVECNRLTKQYKRERRAQKAKLK